MSDKDFDLAELELTRIRDTIGHSIADRPLEERLLARTLNRAQPLEHPAPAPQRRRLLPALSAAAALVFAIIVLVSINTPTPAIAAPPGLEYEYTQPEDVLRAPPARDVLLHIADIASENTDSHANDSGDIQFISTFGWDIALAPGNNDAGILPYQRHSWLTPDGKVTTIERREDLLTADGQLDPQPFQDLAFEGTITTSPGGEIEDLPGRLPRDPASLENALGSTKHSAPSTERTAYLLAEIQDLATTFLVPGDLYEGIWTLLANEPAVHYLGTTTDRLGRSVIAIAAEPFNFQTGPEVLTLLINPENGHVIGSEATTLHSDELNVAEPTVTEFTTIAHSEYQEETHEFPSTQDQMTLSQGMIWKTNAWVRGPHTRSWTTQPSGSSLQVAIRNALGQEQWWRKRLQR